MTHVQYLQLITAVGGVQSLKEGLEVAINGPRVYDTEMIESFVSDGSGSEAGSSRSQGEEGTWDIRQSGSTSNSMEELEKQSRERSGRYSMSRPACQPIFVPSHERAPSLYYVAHAVVTRLVYFIPALVPLLHVLSYA